VLLESRSGFGVAETALQVRVECGDDGIDVQAIRAGRIRRFLRRDAQASAP
jgi:hypothetical protein